MTKPILRIEDLHFSYAVDQPILQGIDLSIYRGEKIAVVGPNGAGKSTLFLQLNGVLTPEKGFIYLHEKIITKNKEDLNQLRQSVGIIFQEPDYQIIASNVLQEISFGPMNQQLSKEQVLQRVEDALETLHIMHLKQRPPHYLSGGEKKQVTIASVIAMQPEIIILDEPTASLDPLHVQGVEEVLDELTKRQTTLLVSTHDIDFVYRWADRVLVLHEGEIIADGKPSFILSQPDILEKAHLKRPFMIRLSDILRENDMLNSNHDNLESLEQLNHLLKKLSI